MNHFRGAKGLTRKDLLKKHIQRFCREVGGGDKVYGAGAGGEREERGTIRTGMEGSRASESFNIMPVTFVLPREFNGFVKAFSEIERDEKKVRGGVLVESRVKSQETRVKRQESRVKSQQVCACEYK